MSYCSNCGQEIVVGAKYCLGCGSAISNNDLNSKTRNQEYAGKIVKCPSCGEVLASLTAICPSCGHEINSQTVSESLGDFVNAINECDKAIAMEDVKLNTPHVKGWKSWSFTKKILWVIINIMTSCIPLVIYMILPLFKPLFMRKETPLLSANEKKKVSLIENYAFPNEREAIIEALMFIKSKMSFVSSEKFNAKTLYWIGLWGNKAEQIRQKANILLPNDKMVETTYIEINSIKNKMEKQVMARALFGVGIIVIFLIFVLINGNVFKGVGNILSDFQIEQDESDEIDEYVWLDSGLSAKIPKLEGKEGQIYTNTDTDLRISLDGVSYKEFENYISSCKEMGYTINAEKTTNVYEAYNEDGSFLKVSCYGENFSVEVEMPLIGDADFEWPKHELALLVPMIDGKTGTVEQSESELLHFNLYEVSEEEFLSYCALCENNGFVIDVEKNNTNFDAFNSNGNQLKIIYSDRQTMSLTIKTPMEFSKISWPASGPANLIPKPSFQEGNISIDYDWTFSVYIKGMSIDDFNRYVDKCIEKGFKKDSRYERSFWGNKGDDIDLNISYIGFDIMYISITNYNEL